LDGTETQPAALRLALQLGNEPVALVHRRRRSSFEVSFRIGHICPSVNLNSRQATVLEHGLTVVTRNIADFAPTGVPTLDPFVGEQI
jgi:hypothetical protein